MTGHHVSEFTIILDGQTHCFAISKMIPINYFISPTFHRIFFIRRKLQIKHKGSGWTSIMAWSIPDRRLYLQSQAKL